MLVLTRAEVEQLLDLDELVDALARAHAELSAGAASMPPRIAAFAEEDGLLGAMPGYLPSAGLGCKLVSVFPHNAGRPSHQAAIALFDPANGSPLALMDGTHITAARTAGAAALAARLLARDDARVLAILGTGVQARSHARAFAGIRDWQEIRLAGRDRTKTEELAAEIGARAASFEDAVRGADVVAATTHSSEPVVRLDWVAAGTHVGSVGFAAPGFELDPELVRAATIVVESRASAFAPSPAGAPELAGIEPASVAELGELVAGTRPGRASPDEITLYKSVGVAVQDLAAAALVLSAARERGTGIEIELEEIHA
ncbi:MAG TPA: ornithine cyclodeaminase family protein [Gaiellaceae bacterium]|nr:ornithine cyclodeaminase family protein [Gaiellaceae bacterium]